MIYVQNRVAYLREWDLYELVSMENHLSYHYDEGRLLLSYHQLFRQKMVLTITDP